MLHGALTLPFHSETGHLGQRHSGSPETQTSALSWSESQQPSEAAVWAAVMQCLPGQDIPPRGQPAEGLRQASGKGAGAERGLGQEGEDGVANGTSTPRQGWYQPQHRCLPKWGGAGRRLHTQQIPPSPTNPAWRETKLCLSILPPSSQETWCGQCPRPPTHTPPQRCAIKIVLQKRRN